MKKQLIALGLASVLTVPSVVFAEATWYGSLRTMVHSKDTLTLQDAATRFGFRGSNEVASGLNAIYRFETKIDTPNATLSGGRLSWVGLEGGFGTIRMGQMWSASYNHVGVLTDNTIWDGNNLSVTGRERDLVSYSGSAGAVSFQLDAMMRKSGGEDDEGGTDEDIDATELGVTVDAGPVNVAMAFTSAEAGIHDAMEVDTTSLAVVAPLGDFTLAAAWKEKDVGGEKTDATALSISGPLGDTGLSFALNLRDIEADDNAPWSMNIVKSLGGGARLAFEHIALDKDGVEDETLIMLRVDF